MLKALVTLAIATGLVVGGTGMDTAPRFAEKLAEFQATTHGIAVAHAAHIAAPDDAHAERTYIALTRHCANLAALYNAGAPHAADELADAGLPASIDAVACS